jgi:uncharacterized protein (TIGR03437 family)
MLKNAIAICVFCLFLPSLVLQAQTQQNVFALPGANSTGSAVQVFSANPFNTNSSFTAGPGTFLVVAKPDGSKFYAIANSGSSTVTVVPNNFSSPRSIAGLGTQATAAAISEDGKRLAVAAGSLHIFDTSTDTDLTPNGVNVGAGVTVFDVAASLDGTTFYALGSNTAGGSVLAAVNASSPAATATLPITGPTIGVAVGPNALIYVSAPNQILEINPTTLTTTSSVPIQVNAKPGKLVFTPDGLYALAVNQTPITGSSVLLIGISSHAVVSTVGNIGVGLDRLLVINSTSVLAYSAGNQSLYQISISSGPAVSINPYSLAGISSSNSVTGLALSSEVPSAGRGSPEYLYAAINGILYQEDLPTSTLKGQFPLSASVGAVSYAGPATTGTLASTLLQYGNNQNLPANATSLPIVVRVLDNNGNPISGATVTFASNNSSASVSPASATTGTNGYAVTYLTAPAASGPLTVTAMAGNQTAAYTMNIGTAGGGPVTAGISIIAGQGQILFENFSTSNQGSPLTVQVNDANGNPLSNVNVTFAVTQGPGVINSLGAQPGTLPNSIIIPTGSNGQASAQFTAQSIGSTGTGFASTTVAVSAPNAGSVNFFVTTTPQNSSAQISVTPTPGAAIPFVGAAGSTITGALTVKVTSLQGSSIPNVGVTINSATPNGPSASCNNPTGTGLLTDPTGTASCDLVLSGVIGTSNFSVNVGSFESFGTYTIQVTPGSPAKVNIVQGNNQTGSPGQRLSTALKVQITDTYGNTLSGVPVAWSVVSPGTVVLSGISTATDNNGFASALATLGTTAGPAQVKVTVGTITATFTLNVTIPSAGIQKVSGDTQTTIINTSFGAPLVVSVVDSSGNPVANAPVTWTATGGATLSSASSTTGTNGQASITVNAGATAGPITVTATTASFSVTFNLTSVLPGPTNVSFTNAASFLAGNGVAPGEIVIVSGNGIASGVKGLVTAYNLIGQPLPALAGISVTFNGVTAPIYYVMTASGQPDQVAVQVPFETQPGAANVIINSAGGGNGSFTVQVQQFAPGIFQTTIAGQTIAVAVRSDGSYVSPSNPAQRGENIQIYITGLGQVTPAAATGAAGLPNQAVAGNIVVGLNNGGVPLVSAQYAQNMVGVYVLTLQVPSDTQPGPAQPVGVVAYDSAGNTYFAQGSVIPIQ